MKINKEKLSSITSMDDNTLWREIRAIGASYGITLPEKTPPKSELDKVRYALCGTKLNLGEAIGIINNYKKGETNGKRN